MSNAYHDANGVHTLLAVEADGTTLVNVSVDNSSHELQVSGGTSGTDNGPTVSFHDFSHVPILMGTSLEDGHTPVSIYCDSLGFLFVDSI